MLIKSVQKQRTSYQSCCCALMVVLQRWLFQKNRLYTVHITSFHLNRQFRVASEPNELKVRVLGLLEEAGVPGGNPWRRREIHADSTGKRPKLNISVKGSQ